ncbi:MAG: N-acetyl-gamma-glutamyl-phosphate reductase [Pirellulaceae bacterium]
MVTRVGILGARGYAALELIKILLRHPAVEITVLTSRLVDEPHVSEVHPQLAGRLDLGLEQFDLESLVGRVDVVFSCLPHAASAEVVCQLVDAGVTVIDFSADYRLDDIDVYQQWYEVEHPDPGRVGKVPYGLPELYREQIVGAPLVANPGCYPTSAILPLAPLLSAGLISTADIVVDSKSGVSGAGRIPRPGTLYPECNESISAYGVGAHRHTPEINQLLSAVAGSSVEVIFTPHLVPMNRGILTTIYAPIEGDASEQELMDALQGAYQQEPFVQVVEQLPATSHVTGTNYCHLTARRVGGRAVLVSCLDNLVKGASGAAVQNFNLLMGLEETTALVDGAGA